MCKGLIGKKIGMTGLYTPKGAYIPVSVIQAGPCVVVQVKSEAIDGYKALQLGFEEKKESRVNKPLQGHMKKGAGKCFALLNEFSIEGSQEYKMGQVITVDNIFKIGERVDISGTSKGRGFAGVVKRYGFSGGRKTHGGMCHRLPGSIGSSAWPSRVVKGKRMPGHYGNHRITVRNLEVVDIKPVENLILVKGSIPGARRGFLEIRKPKVVVTK
ncbi:MAG: 50S ribosomal protein L3 [Desulfobacterales bacterium]|nr:50S ribosomal protein L3 [Desulfobacterales bacterium]MBF0396444.1 50S ribosomal protein L3 [Desulfobacterales bacterium]